MMWVFQIVIIVVVGLFIKVDYGDDYLRVQTNNKYTWIEYNGVRKMLQEKEIYKIYCDKIIIGVN